MTAKYIETIYGSIINVNNIESVEIEDFELACGTGMVAVAYMASGKRHILTNPCSGDDEKAENFPAILARIISAAPDGSVITTIPTDNPGILAHLVGEKMPEGFAASVLYGGARA